MVNIPPIPPLLCSTPPPIDFGDEEDVDVGADDGAVESDFSDFLGDDDSKNSEPLPLHRPTDLCDLLPVSIYDGLVPPEEDVINHIMPLSFQANDDKTCNDTTNNAKSIKFAEAFNFDVRNKINDTRNIGSELGECKNKSEGAESCLANEKYTCVSKSDNENSRNKNIKDLKIESLNVVPENYNTKRDLNYMQTMVSIEDIEDDLSDDEIYSPKTPKTYIETDNLSDYFKIEEIKSPHVAEKEGRLNPKLIDSEPLSFIDNNESASSEKCVELKSSTSSSVIQNRLETPSPLQDDESSVDDDDDFGEFADFQEANYENNIVPVNDYIKQHDALSIHSSDYMDKYSTTENLTNVNAANGYENASKHADQMKNPEEVDHYLNDDSGSCSITTDKKEIYNEKVSKQESLNLEEMTQEILNDKTEENEEYMQELNKNDGSISESSHKDQSFDNMKTRLEINDNDEFGSFAEFPESLAEDEKAIVMKKQKIQDETKACKDISNDDNVFNDFSKFESNPEGKQAVENHSSSCNVQPIIDEEDDDFGDFNTAEPITPNTCTIAVAKTSQDTAIETPAQPQKNLRDRISKILHAMFSPVLNPASEPIGEPNTNKIHDIPFTSIDAAKALEYQWMISDTRHSFIRSLGIDSRNILFGDNWNPSLPRFAANLSFNPLKPMKPVQSSRESNSMLESISVNTSESTKPIEKSSTAKTETLDLSWKSSSPTERSVEGFQDNRTHLTNNSTSTTSMAYIPNEPPTTDQVSLTMFENMIESEDTISKTPPISEMESVTKFSSSLPAASMNVEVPSTQVLKSVKDFDLSEVDENLTNTHNANEVVATSTFTGSFKETHIYTPSKSNDFDIKHANTMSPTLSCSPMKVSPIDFDYEKAAMGVIIDETVVKKEYRDVEYNPPFTMVKSVGFEGSSYTNTVLSPSDIEMSENDAVEQYDQEANDDFSDYQSVPSEVTVSATSSVPKSTNHSEPTKTAAVSHGGMILSPAILIPKAISMENIKPKIEWGDSTATINPEELARIEELFPEPKTLKSSTSSLKSTPTHQMLSTPSISATIANKELEGNINDDDDDWSDFVSVTVTNNASTNRTFSNNNIFSKSPGGSPFMQRSPLVSHRLPPATHSNSNCDDEWSDFVSGAPAAQHPNSYRVPQFNSGAWQNANYYNNPLSMYHKGPLNVPATATCAHNNNNNNNHSQQPYQAANNLPTAMMGINHPKPNNTYQQQVHLMQNFSTAPIPTPERLSAAAATSKNNQFQSIGSAKVAPSIALIPDLGFVAPAIPTHTSFINSLPKPSINMKK